MTDCKNVTLDTDELGIWLVEEGVDGHLTQQMGFISWKDVARGVQNALLQDKMMLALQEMGQEFDKETTDEEGGRVMKVWVLTREHNDYDQHGEYFCAVFQSKPTLEQLANWFKSNDECHHYAYIKDPFEAVEFLEHVRKGGGRQETEDVWYLLDEVTAEKGGE